MTDQLENDEILGDGEDIHWPEIDEDLSVIGLLRGSYENAFPNPFINRFQPPPPWSKRSVIQRGTEDDPRKLLLWRY